MSSHEHASIVLRAKSPRQGPARHLSAIQSLSEKHRVPVGIVAELYIGEWNVLRKNARLTDYLSVFVSRRVSERLNTLKAATTAVPNVRSRVQ